MKKAGTQNRIGSQRGILLLLIVFMISVSVANADCRSEGCGCSGVWDSSWAGNAQETCTGTDCWYDPKTGTGCSGHHWYLYSHQPAEGCTTDGETRYLCTNCAAIFRKVEKAPGHSFSTWERKDSETHQRICRVCRKTETVLHSYGNWIIVDAGTKYRNCSVCNNRDTWIDREGPVCQELKLIPAGWSRDRGTVSFTVTDEKSGIKELQLSRVSAPDGITESVAVWEGNGDAMRSECYTETREGIFSYILFMEDMAGNRSRIDRGQLMIDRTPPDLTVNGIQETWSSQPISIRLSGEDCFPGSSVQASGISHILLLSEDGTLAASGDHTIIYTLDQSGEGVHTWTGTGEDRAGNTGRITFTTRYDHTRPMIEGNGEEIQWTSGMTAEYCADDRIFESIYDPVCMNGCGGSGIQNISLYQIKNGEKHRIPDEAISIEYQEDPQRLLLRYDASDSDTGFYLIAAQDRAGNLTTKKILCQKALLRSIHTSIDRSSYR